MKYKCYACNKELRLMELLVGKHNYCSFECYEAIKNEKLNNALNKILSCAVQPKENLTQDQKNILQKAQESICPKNTWKENLRALENLGTKN